MQQKDAPARISGLEAFLTQYPNSVMKEDALELLMGAYGETNNSAKTLETAQKVLLANPCNLRALALLSYTKRAMAEAGQNAAQNLAEAGQNGEKGLQCPQTAPKPEGTSDADFQKLKTQTAGIFNGAAGMAAYQAKNYPKAQQYLRAAVEADPPDPTSLRDVYPLALAYLTPPMCLRWHLRVGMPARRRHRQRLRVAPVLTRKLRDSFTLRGPPISPKVAGRLRSQSLARTGTPSSTVAMKAGTT